MIAIVLVAIFCCKARRIMGKQNYDQLLSRRGVLASAAVAGVALGAGETTADESKASPPRVQYSLNMSTVRGQKLSVPDQVELAAKAGYDAITARGAVT